MDQRADKGLGIDALYDMFDHCLKLAVDNKITDKNVWQIPLINNFCDIIRDQSHGDFNFHKATGGLAASVRIYDKRVDATYRMTYSMLDGLDSKGAAGWVSLGDLVPQMACCIRGGRGGGGYLRSAVQCNVQAR